MVGQPSALSFLLQVVLQLRSVLTSIGIASAPCATSSDDWSRDVTRRLQHLLTRVAKPSVVNGGPSMSTYLAQRSKRDEDQAKVDPRATSPSGLNSAEAAQSADAAVDRYLPGRWSWGPAKPSFDW